MPCTVVNVAIAAVAAVVVGYFSVLGGVAVAVVSGLLIAFRGYLVPGTPTLTKRFMPVWMLAWFGKAPSPDTAGPLAEGPDDQSGTPDPQALLAQAGLLVNCPDEDDVCLADQFRDRWTEVMRSYDADESELRAAVGELLDEPAGELILDPETGDLGEEPRSPVRVSRRNRPADILGFWESYGALLADAAAATVLAEHLRGWSEFESRDRNGVLAALRIFVDTCPACGGSVRLGEETRESCCWSGTVVQVACEECGATYFEADEDTIQREAATA